ncbi:MAG TPA: DUF5685 family protein [Pirellulaceae bacterium]|jgi:hypothetical protein|nr:DUF5685 family protein [Pirellulaceae bacterium]
MFGILRPLHAALDPIERARHASAYCNLCGLIGSRYGFSSRLLVVHDVATLWWLLQSSESNWSLPRANCIRGGSRRLRSTGLSELQRFLAAMSVFTIGVKVEDDVADGGSRRAVLTHRMYRRSFDLARHELSNLGFPVHQLDAIIEAQRQVERDAVSDLSVASQATAEAYALLARGVADRGGAAVSADDAAAIGASLGRSVYLIDALRDFSEDVGKAYNPLCIAGGGQAKTLSDELRTRALYAVGAALLAGRTVYTKTSERLNELWGAIERQMFAEAGVFDRRSVTLYSGVCIPCGKGAVYVDGKTANECNNMCLIVCGCICCGCSQGKCCCS